MNVAVVGAINVDLVVAATRLPGPGETVVGPRLVRHGGGKGANAAIAAARAGASVQLIGAVGGDDNGVGSISELQRDGVDTTHIQVIADEATGAALIVVDPDGENQIAVGAGANAALDHVVVREAIDAILVSGDVGCVLVSTEIPPESVRGAVEAASAAGVLCVLNPAPVLPIVWELLEFAPLLTPNSTELHELAAALGQSVDEDILTTAQLLVERTGSPMVVTLGGDGVLVVTADGAATQRPAPPATVRDTTGAGDTFNGVLATRLAQGDSLDVAVQYAQVAAALSVAHLGARDGMPTAAQIDAALTSDR